MAQENIFITRRQLTVKLHIYLNTRTWLNPISKSYHYFSSCICLYRPKHCDLIMWRDAYWQFHNWSDFQLANTQYSDIHAYIRRCLESGHRKSLGPASIECWGVNLAMLLPICTATYRECTHVQNESRSISMQQRRRVRQTHVCPLSTM